MRIGYACLIGLVIAIAPPALAVEDHAAACDELAAHPRDPGRAADGVEFGDIVVAVALV